MFQELRFEVPERQVDLLERVNEKPRERSKGGQFEVQTAVPEQKTAVLEQQVEVREKGEAVPEGRSVSSERLAEVPEIKFEGLENKSGASTQMVGAERQIKETKTPADIDHRLREVKFYNLSLFPNLKFVFFCIILNII